MLTTLKTKITEHKILKSPNPKNHNSDNERTKQHTKTLASKKVRGSL